MEKFGSNAVLFDFFRLFHSSFPPTVTKAKGTKMPKASKTAKEKDFEKSGNFFRYFYRIFSTSKKERRMQ